MTIITGVYKITNLQTGDSYIGSSKNVKRRWMDHKKPCERTKQPNNKLYKDMQKYGLDNFKFELIEETTEDQRKSREQYYIQTMMPTYNRRNAEGLSDTEYYKSHRASIIKYAAAWNVANPERYKEKQRAYRERNRKRYKEMQREYMSRICIYNGEEIKFATLISRFRKAGIANPYSEAKKYLK